MASAMSLLVWAALVLSATPAAAFYLPGIAPTDYKPGSPMNVKVEAQTATPALNLDVLLL